MATYQPRIIKSDDPDGPWTLALYWSSPDTDDSAFESEEQAWEEGAAYLYLEGGLKDGEELVVARITTEYLFTPASHITRCKQFQCECDYNCSCEIMGEACSNCGRFADQHKGVTE